MLTSINTNYNNRFINYKSSCKIYALIVSIILDEAPPMLPSDKPSEAWIPSPGANFIIGEVKLEHNGLCPVVYLKLRILNMHLSS